jgi:putative toxin-antitoxin system antitoxin component (TIGR02293 family)
MEADMVPGTAPRKGQSARPRVARIAKVEPPAGSHAIAMSETSRELISYPIAQAISATVSVLGGKKTLGISPETPLEVHEMLHSGLPKDALVFLFDETVLLRTSHDFENALGMSLRTFQRIKENPAKLLTASQSGNVWKFAEVLALATRVFGSKDDAEAWMERPALGLDGRKPIDLLSTPAGLKLVEDFLVQMEYGVYA